MDEFGDWHAEENVAAEATQDEVLAPDLYMSSGTTEDEIELEETQFQPQIAPITKA